MLKLVNDTIVIIGNLRYLKNSCDRETQVDLLNLEKFSISKIKTTGICPGWIHKHIANLSDDGKYITVEKGNIVSSSITENIDDWKLNLNDWSWERLTDRKWKQFLVKRSDRKFNHLWEIRHTLFERDSMEESKYKKSLKELTLELGKEPNLDLIESLYRPTISHEPIPQNDNEYNIYPIKVDGVIVRYVENNYTVRAIIEGTLSEELRDAIESDLLQKISSLENTKCEIEII